MSDRMLSLLKQKKVIWLLCSIPLWAIIALAFVLSPKEYMFWKVSHAVSGYASAVLLVLTLSFAPLTKHFPSWKLFFILNRQKRETGLSCFYYAIIHVAAISVKYNLQSSNFPPELIQALLPMLIAGNIAVAIFILLALTSNDFSIKILKYRNWKFLQRWVYPVEAAVFIHMALQGGIVLFWAIALFLPLVAIQLFRKN